MNKYKNDVYIFTMMMDDEINTEDIILNLKMIAKIKQNDKMIVINGIIGIDNRLAQPLRRWYTADNRDHTITFITNVVNVALFLCNNIDGQICDKDTIKNELQGIIPGLDNMSATYKTDNLMVAKIELLKDKIRANLQL